MNYHISFQRPHRRIRAPIKKHLLLNYPVPVLDSVKVWTFIIPFFPFPNNNVGLYSTVVHVMILILHDFYPAFPSDRASPHKFPVKSRAKLWIDGNLSTWGLARRMELPCHDMMLTILSWNASFRWFIYSFVSLICSTAPGSIENVILIVDERIFRGYWHVVFDFILTPILVTPCGRTQHRGRHYS